MGSAAPDVRRFAPRLWWFALAVLVVAGLITFEVGARLGRQHAGDDLSFGPSAFTGPRWPPTDIGPLGDALASWTAEPAIGSAAGRLVITYTVVDLVAFTPAYILLMWSVMRWLMPPVWNPRGWGRQAIISLPVVLLAVEVAESTTTLGILKPWNWGEGPVELAGSMWLIALLSTVKWALIVVLAMWLVTFAYVRFHRRTGPRSGPQRR